MTKMYEQVVLVRPLHLDFTGAIMEPGAKAVVVDLLDDDVVLLEFDLDAPELVTGKRFESTMASTSDFVRISS